MKKFIYILTSALLILTSCSKESIEKLPNVDEIAKQDALLEVASANADGIFEEILKINSAGPFTKGIWGERYLTGSVTITVRDSAGVRIFLVDFGTAGNVGLDGKTRKGKLIAYIVNNGRTGSEQKIKYLDFIEDGNLFSGFVTRKITRDIDARTQEAVITENFKVTAPDGIKFIIRVASLNRVIKMGDPATREDDVIETYGTATVTNEQNKSRSRIIEQSNPLVFKVSASEIVKGVVKTTLPDGKVITTDYGDGTVDNTATVTDGERTWTIKLKRVPA